MSDSKNPFDKLGLDPTLSPGRLTERLQRMAERLPPEERDEIRARWRELTLRDADRIRLAFFAHPRGEETGAEPIDTLRRRVPPARSKSDAPPFEARLVDALLDFTDASNSGTQTISRALQPDAGFSAMIDEAEALGTITEKNRS